MGASPLLARVERRAVLIIEAFPKGSFEQTVAVCLPLALAASAAAAWSSQATAWRCAALWMLGMVGWTLLEYLIHRFAFHLKPWDKISAALLGRLHLRHHDDPDDRSQVCVPVVLSAPFALLIYAGIVAAGAPGAEAAIFTGGVAVMAALYDMAHYGAHYGKPRGALLRWIRRNHHKHHFGDPRTRFGVTTPVWDYLFGTLR